MNEEEFLSHEIDNSDGIDDYFESTEAWRNPVTRRDYFELLDENDFLDLTQRIASLVRGKTSNEQQDFDGKTVELKSSMLPDHREKEVLLRETWHTAQAILKDRSLEDRDALELAALTVAGGLVLTHPFADGNGRTSRALSFLIARGSEKKGELKQVLSVSSGGGKWYTTPSAKILFPRFKRAPWHKTIDFGDFIAGTEEDAYGGEIAESTQSQQAISEFIHFADPDTKALIAPYLDETQQNPAGVIDGQALLKALADSPRAIEYRSKIDEIMRAARTKYVKQYLSVMKNTDDVEVSGILKARASGETQKKRLTKQVLDAIQNDGHVPLREQVRSFHRVASSLYDDDQADETKV